MERVSALMDGELGAVEIDAVITRVSREEEAREEWETYHLIGDALRNMYLVREDFAVRMSTKLSDEPTVLAPKPRRTVRKMQTYALSVAASAAAIAVVGWLAFSHNPLVPEQPGASLAGMQPSPALITPVKLPPASLNKNVRAYLLAHQEFSPATEIQGVAPYVRTMSESASENTR